ncbi:MAG: hypothetical protein J6Q68_04375 [Clostridia bacterium]|nr:hypothetical protein [Clostridia bacterium]
MKRKLICLAVVLVISSMLFACGDDPVCTEHTDVNKDLLCDNCQAALDCTHIDENNDGICDIDACKWNYDHEHTYSSDWSHDETNHWHAPTCSHTVEPKDKRTHVDENNDGICDECVWDYDHEHTYEEEWERNEEEHWKNPTCTHTIDPAEKGSHTDKNNDGNCDSCLWDYGHEHTYDDFWSHDETHHWHEANCTHNIEPANKTAHIDENNDGICDGCLWNYDHNHTYNESWESDATGHWHTASCGHSVTTDKTAHDDSNNDGICRLCNYVICSHEFDTSVWAKDEDGHWHPTTCGHTAVKGEVFKHDLDEDAVCLTCGYPTDHIHSFSEEWSYNAGYHWHSSTCEHPTKQKDKAEHDDADKDGKCNTCEYQFCTHTFAKVYSFGENTHWYAATCGCNVKGEEVEHFDHDGDSQGVCDACGYQVCNHTYSNEWSYNESAHWHAPTCAHTTLLKDKNAHVDENNDGFCEECEKQYCTHKYKKVYTTNKTHHWIEATCGCDVIKDKEAHTENEQGYCFTCNYQMCNHTYGAWHYDEEKHWRETTCGHSDANINEPHRDVDINLFCDLCEQPYEDPNAEAPEPDPDDMIITPPFIISPSDEEDGSGEETENP